MKEKRAAAVLVFAGMLSFEPFAAFATTYVDEGFETNHSCDVTPYCWSSNTVCNSGQTTCSDSDGTYVTFDQTVTHSGSYSMKANIPVPGGAGVVIDPDTYTTPSWSAKTSLYLRFYVKYDPAFRWYNRTKIVVWRIANGPDLYVNCNGATWPWSGDDGVASCDVGLYFGMSPTDACGSTEPWASDEFYYIAKPSGANKGQTWLVKGDGWYYMEVFVDTLNRRLDFWMQRPGDSTPTKILNNISLAGCSQLGKTNNYFEGLEADGFLNSAAGPSGGIYYFDDIAIADTYNGPKTAGAAGRPSVPSALQVQN